MRRSALPVLLVVVLVSAGCAAPVADSATPGEVATEGNGEEDVEPVDVDGLEVRGGTLSFDENRTFERVETMLEVEIVPPTVYVEEPTAAPSDVQRDPSSFLAVMGVPPPDSDDAGDELSVGGVASPMQAVYVIPPDGVKPAEVEQVLVHEFVHAAQFQEEAPQRVQGAIPRDHRGTTDAHLASLSLIEGGAVYGSTAYTERYDVAIESEGELLEDLYANASPGTRLAWGPYHHGYRYVDDHAASPEDHWELYDEPPLTTAQVLEREPRSAAELESFDAGLSADGTDWRVDPAGSDTMGAFVLRTVLSTELSGDRSRAATEGWAYDRVLRVSADGTGEDGDDRDGYAWSVRFEDADAAAVFEDALYEYLESRSDAGASDETVVDDSNATGASGTPNATTPERATWETDEHAFRVETGDDLDPTVTLFAGDGSFVDSASVESVRGGDVRIVLEEAAESTSLAATVESDRPLEPPVAVDRGTESVAVGG